MKVLNQEEYRKYHQDLKEQGYNPIETIIHFPDDKIFKILEERIGPMPWNLLK